MAMARAVKTITMRATKKKQGNKGEGDKGENNEGNDGNFPKGGGRQWSQQSTRH
jgi:hypothetical protein